MTIRIALDAMGTDKAPYAEIEGALMAATECSDYEIRLVGDTVLLEQWLAKKGPKPGNLILYHASETIGMDEPAAISVRRKKDSSINVGAQLLKDGIVDAFVSAGNTGAVVCAVTLKLGLLEGIDRPGIAIIYPTLKDSCVLVDAGANIDPKPEHLFQYAIMGDVLQRHIFGKKDVKIGLLNIGEEESKGTDFIKQTHNLLNSSNLKFMGNMEGRDIYSGEYDVIVCDGFVGNVVLKVSEGLAYTLIAFLKRKLKQDILTKLGAFLIMPAYRSLKKEIDYSEYGGAPLLGIDGVCIISHGSSSPKAIKNAIREAAEFVSHQVNQHILKSVMSISPNSMKEQR